MQQITLVDNYTLRPSEVDVDHLQRISSIADMFQNSAWRSAEQLGFGYNELNHEGLAWVLSRLYVKICTYPRWGEHIELHTWPKRSEKLFAMRDFLVFSDEDASAPVIHATSAWLLVDVKKKRPRRIESLEQPMPMHNDDAVSFVPGKIQLPESLSQNKEIKVQRSDLDMNYHTNNSSYIRWVEDLMPMQLLHEHRVHELQINFLGESFIHDRLSIQYSLDSELTGRIVNEKQHDIIHFTAGFAPVNEQGE